MYLLKYVADNMYVNGFYLEPISILYLCYEKDSALSISMDDALRIKSIFNGMELEIENHEETNTKN